MSDCSPSATNGIAIIMQAASTSTRLLILVLVAVTLAFVSAIAGGHAIAAGWRLDASYSSAAGEMPLISRLSYTGSYRFVASEPAMAQVDTATTILEPEKPSLPAAHAVATTSTLPKAEPAVAIVGTPRENEAPTRVTIIEPPTAVVQTSASPAVVETPPIAPVAIPTEFPAAPKTESQTIAIPPAIAASAMPGADATPLRAASLPVPPPTATDDAPTARALVDGPAPAATMKPAGRAAPLAPGLVTTLASKPPVSSDAPAATPAAPPSPAAALDDDDEADEDAASPQRQTSKRVSPRVKRQTAAPRPVVRKPRVAKAGGDNSANPSQAPRWARGAFTPD